MTNTRTARRVDKGPLWILGCSGVFFLLLLSPFLAMSVFDNYLRIWSISVSNGTGKSLSIILTFDGVPDRAIRIDGVRADAIFGSYLYSERRDATLRSICVIEGQRERTTTLSKSIDVGCDLRVDIDPDLSVRTSLDQDAH
ncbi:MAG: hypothetical protein K8U03_25305 [Planctomycetia bacterium]|nr:hypothetical protein [Planctomycetia bacterium]